MAAAILGVAVPQFFDDDGLPLAGGFLYSYQAGSAFGTPQSLYTDSALAVAYTNPIELDASGRPNGPIYMLATPAYDLILKDAALVTIWTATNIIAPTVP